MTAMAGAAAERAERGHLDAFRLAGATSPERARPLETMGLVRDTAFARLTARGVLRAQGSGVYLDEAALLAHRAPPRSRLVVVLMIVLLVAAGLAALAAGMRLR